PARLHFFFSSRRRHTRWPRDWSSDVCSSDLFIQGRDFREDETFPGKAIVNEAFVQQCFDGRIPIGQSFEKETGDGVTRWRFEVVGVVGNAHYRNLREPMTPTAYVPFFGINRAGRREPKN